MFFLFMCPSFPVIITLIDGGVLSTGLVFVPLSILFFVPKPRLVRSFVSLFLPPPPLPLPNRLWWLLFLLPLQLNIRNPLPSHGSVLRSMFPCQRRLLPLVCHVSLCPSFFPSPSLSLSRYFPLCVVDVSLVVLLGVKSSFSSLFVSSNFIFFLSSSPSVSCAFALCLIACALAAPFASSAPGSLSHAFVCSFCLCYVLFFCFLVSAYLCVLFLFPSLVCVSLRSHCLCFSSSLSISCSSIFISRSHHSAGSWYAPASHPTLCR